MKKNLDLSRTYKREGVDVIFNKVKAEMHASAVINGNGVALYEDCYTGKVLRGGERYDYEHIISSEEVFSQYKNTHTNEEIAQIVNCPQNIKTTLREINQSKGKTPLLNWLTDANVAKFSINKRLTLKNHEIARRAIEQKATELL